MFPNDYYEYNLTGCLIHLGTANSGHYYSLINPKDEENNRDPNNWFEFNDHNVTKFDIKNLANVAFGG